MRHFGHLADDVRARLFLEQPRTFTAQSEPAVLATALGGTLYSPATRPALAADIRKLAARGVVSMVLCLEDAIADHEVDAGERNLVEQIADLVSDFTDCTQDHPLLFIRVRTAAQILDLAERLGPAVGLLSGFVLPKFTAEDGGAYLAALAAAEAATGRRLFAMPVLESPELAHLETRREQLFGIAELLAAHRERVLAVRLGVTDLCSAYGLRRSPDLTAYDVALVAAVIGDVVNVLGRADGTGYTVTGPVWEYFPVQERMFKPQLRRTPFAASAGTARASGEEVRRRIIEHDLDGLIREVELDRTNGLLGKTCIHPSHVPAVHALSVVTHEEYCDARDILRQEQDGGGVLRSAYTNKMNEARPHRAWAERVLLRAEVFGVAREDVSFAELLSACLCG
ncbi:HpcH/HpaI aldolase/citrate lyase family protein [Kitasatospora aureofaciens]|uniref:ATP/GTP-binding protein n=1 Tax=Kitasatospora aureofaciens TaxID=1894 RepID=A0A1E7MYX5_KITAU|nr:HpcH/HpaI aldolase/citrate lyase family protein [Kitasatospora aureofaciens]QEV01782.1 ATP/GTP-binding protein [Streptomyces viridifaciens]ARF80538.1 ATP/GTP-binding protein [Kitasatospora aureofaciens]OEV33433.1 ATP/GTP-binding protein [Kitasatospora aureofaciens]UKZ08223.1 HpcH/HpaI aldolase/citrate lyase family protein [Streptomyces viridifaciens]GGU59873.1 ATP/GTP-binding protein [Kitasatospora aureofaciens]